MISCELNHCSHLLHIAVCFGSNGTYLDVFAGHIGQTFEGVKQTVKEDSNYKGYTLASYEFDKMDDTLREGQSGADDVADERSVLDEFDIGEYKNSRWCYDTPGVVNPEQVG